MVIDDQIGFAEGANIKSAVKNECGLGNKFANFLEQYISDAGITVVRASSDGAKSVNKRLHIEINRVLGAAGGWTGGKRSMQWENQLKMARSLALSVYNVHLLVMRLGPLKEPVPY